MWRWARWVLLVVGVVFVGGAADFAWVDHQQRIVWREREVVFARELAEMQQAFPIGTSRDVVVSGLHSRYPQFAIGGGTPDVQVWLGKEPSFVWYCNYMEPFVEFTFRSDGTEARLVKVERRTTGQCL
jgi:hypothetical protein